MTETRHLTATIYGSFEALNDGPRIVHACLAAAHAAGATVLNYQWHQFEPHGVTALVLLSESHLSIHTWPEKGSAAVDVFTCGDAKPRKALDSMLKDLDCECNQHQLQIRHV